jgi:hypothetical protein
MIQISPYAEALKFQPLLAYSLVHNYLYLGEKELLLPIYVIRLLNTKLRYPLNSKF